MTRNPFGDEGNDAATTEFQADVLRGGGLMLIGIGILAQTSSSVVVFALIGNDAKALAAASGIASGLAQAVLLLGVVLLGGSPLARMLERP